MLDKKIETIARFSSILCASVIFSSSEVKAQSIFPANDGTGTIVTPQGNSFDIHGGQLSGDGRNLFHSFQEFGLERGEVANFLSNPNIDNILGRVTGGNPSLINGLLQVTGGNSNLFLMNPAGIIFGSDASLNVTADFTATTATGIGFGDRWFNAGGDNTWSNLVGMPNAFQFATAVPGSIVNEGNLAVPLGHHLGLVGGTVVNTGTLQAPGGSISISAIPGENLVRLSAAGNVLSLDVLPIDNTGITARSLPELLTGGYVNHASKISVNPDGAIALVGSERSINPQPGDAIVSGQLSVTSVRDSTLNSIEVLGERVALLGSTIDASGSNGGGNISIGGDYQGNGTIPTARQTFVDGNSFIFADAWQQGNGGRVIVWSDDSTGFFGKISARGGNISGNGGFVEVSGRENLGFNGEVNVSAIRGLDGTLLLDPRDIIIQAGTGKNDDQLKEDPVGSIFLGDGDDVTDFTISDIALTAIAGNIRLEAQQDILAEAGTNLNFINQTLGETITFQAGRDIRIDTPIQTADGSIDFLAERSITLQGVNVGAGNISLTSNEINLLGGYSSVKGTGNLLLQPFTPEQNILLGEVIDSSLEVLDLTTTELITFENGFNLIIIGREDGSGTIVVAAQVPEFYDSIEIRSPVGEGSIIAYGDFWLRDRSSITLRASQKIVLESFVDEIIDEERGDVTIEAGGDIQIAGNISTESQISNGGNISLISHNGGITVGSLNTAAGRKYHDGDANAGSITLLARGDLRIDGGVSSRAGRTNGALGVIDSTIVKECDGVPCPEPPPPPPPTGADGNTNAGDITILSFEGSIFIGGGIFSYSYPQSLENTTAVDANGGTVRLQANNDIDVAAIATFVGQGTATAIEFEGDHEPIFITGSSNPGAIEAISFNGSIAVGDIDTSADLTSGGNIIFIAPSGNVTTGDLRSNGTLDGGSIGILSGGIIDTTAGIVNAIGGNNGGNILFDADSDIITSGIGSSVLLSGFNANSGSLSLISDGNVDTSAGALITASAQGAGGDITIDAQGEVNTAQVNSFSFSQSNPGGEINILAEDRITLNGDIETNRNNIFLEAPVILADNLAIRISEAGNIVVRETIDGAYNLLLDPDLGEVDLNGAIGSTIPLNSLEIRDDLPLSLEPINISTRGNIIAQNITSPLGISLRSSQGTIVAGSLDTSATEDAGNITLGANENILLNSINTQSENGTGGDVNITLPTYRLLRLSDSFTDMNGIDASISTAGGTEGGSIVIRHGGNGITPFTIGNATTNGTAGAITRGTGTEETIFPNQSYRYTHTQNEEQIQIISVPEPPPPPPIEPPIDEEPELPENPEPEPEPEPNVPENPEPEISPIPEPEPEPEPYFPIDPSPNPTPIPEPINPEPPTLTEPEPTPEPEIPPIENPPELPTDPPPETPPPIETEPPEITPIPEEPNVETEPQTNTNSVESLALLIGRTIGAQTTLDRDPETNALDITWSIPDLEFKIVQTVPGAEPTPGEDLAILQPVDREPRVADNPATTTSQIDPIIETPTRVTSNRSSDRNTASSSTPSRGTVVNSSPSPSPSDETTAPEPEANSTPESPEPTPENAGESLPNNPLPSGITPETIATTLLSGNTNSLVSEIDQFLEEQFEEAAGENLDDDEEGITVDNIKETLKKIETETGKRGVILYAIVLSGDQRRDILKPETDLLLLVLVIPDGPPISKTLEFDPETEDIRDEINKFSGNLNANNSDQYKYRAQKLYRWFIEPVASHLEERNIDTIIFSMDAGLRQLPLAALHDGQQFLVERYSLGSIPSMSLTNTSYQSLKNARVLAMGASEFPNFPHTSPLPAVPAELATIVGDGSKSLTGLRSGRLFLNENFTQANLQHQRQQDSFGIVHLATHANFDGRDLDNIYIQFWDDRLSLDDLREVQWYDDFPVELLVLSACETAVGNFSTEMGLAGLAVRSGVKSAVASFWKVDDLGTLGVMSQFYHHLQDAPIKAEALRQAQLALLRGEVKVENGQLIGRGEPIALPPELQALNGQDFSHPSYWAGFTMLGSPW